MKILVTGGAGYIGSLLTALLLQQGHRVTVLDTLLFGGESLLPFLTHPHFHFYKVDVSEKGAVDGHLEDVDAVVHLAAIVGFPACQQLGEQVAWRYNVEATQHVFEAAERGGANRFVFASTYSNYGLSADGEAVTEESPLNPQSLYAKTKIAAENFLLGRGGESRCVPVIPRFATLFGISPRMRFDLILNQFVLEALTRRKVVIYQRDYFRSFIHVRDVVDAVVLLLEAPDRLVRGEVFNVGGDDGNYSKQEIIELIQEHVAGVTVEYKDLSFGGDMRDVRISFRKIRERLGFKPRRTVEEGIVEVREAIESGLIADPTAQKYRNHRFIVN